MILIVKKIFKNFGFDSIIFTRLANTINDYYQINITPALFYGIQTIAELSLLLIEKNPQVFQSLYAKGDETSQTKRIPAVIPANPITGAYLTKSRPVAIIGMSAIFPQSENISTFWDHIIAGHDLISEVPEDRWDSRIYPIKWGGFIPDVDKFDPQFFGISPKEAEFMDPQQRLCLQTIWKTIEDAGYRASDLSGSQTGVFIGMQGAEYSKLLTHASTDMEALAVTGTAQVMMANRISFLLNLHGPSESIDTACSSSLVAIHRAIHSIRHDQCSLAIAGGVNLLLAPQMSIGLQKTGVLSDDGRCKTFDKSADGYVRSEGVGALLLKPLDQAEADNDHIYAVIKGSAENHGGRASSLTAPNPKAQSELLMTAYENAGIPPDTVTYIEAHGTGTSLGDPVEIDGLKQAFSQLYERSNRPMAQTPICGIGSVKTNIGHLETAAGVAGVIKVILSMQHQILPSNIHFSDVNPYIQLENSPIYIVTKQQEWKSLQDKSGNPVPRRSGVSSFGFGGSNAHVVLEEYIDNRPEIESTDPKIIVLSAKNKERLYDYATILLDYCSEKNQDISLIDMAYTLQIGRESMDERLAIVVSDMDEMIEKLFQFTQKTKNQTGIYTGNPKQKDDQRDLLVSGKEGKIFINAILQEKNISKIAQLWISGIEIDWQLLYDTPPKRISLPTYPFDKKRYWIHQKENIQVGTITSQTSQLHPLVHQNISDMEAQQFSTVLTGTEFFLKDHVVNSNKTLPGVAYLEMAFFACKQSTKASFLEMADIVWIQPVVFEDTPKEIIFQLHPSNNQIDFQIKMNTSDSQDPLFTQGKLIAGNTPLKETINITEIQSRCSQPSDTNDIYNNFHKHGYEYGPTFQPIKKLYMGENESLSYLRLPDQAQKDFNQYGLHPSLMDGALQTISGIAFAKTSDDIFMPFSIKRIIYCQPLPISCFAYASMKSNSDTQKFDISIVDESGTVCVKIIDFTLRPIQKKELPEMIYFKPQWQPKEIEQSESSIQEKVLIFTNNNSDAFKALCPNHIIVNAGESFEQLSETHYCIRPDNGKDYQQLIRHTGLPEYILHCWSKEGFQTDKTSINQALTESFYSLFHLTQTLIANKLSTPLSIVYVCSMDHPIFNSDYTLGTKNRLLNTKFIWAKLLFKPKNQKRC
jgi:polyketide synthase PksN